MRLSYFYICSCLILFSNCGANINDGKSNSKQPKNSESTMSITYIDQNNNTYRITENNFSYTPITEIESSSGTYNGGEPVSKEITSETFKELETVARNLMKENPVLIPRRMLTAVLLINQGTATEKAILKKSETRTQFEKLLTSLKKPSQ